MTQKAGKTDFDVAVIGGGLKSAPLRWASPGAGQRVALLDEGDPPCAPPLNFALVWVQSKGLGMPDMPVGPPAVGFLGVIRCGPDRRRAMMSASSGQAAFISRSRRRSWKSARCSLSGCTTSLASSATRLRS
jgi:hypothetical protein